MTGNWTPNEQTAEMVHDFLQKLYWRLPYIIGIDELLNDCTVIHLDPFGAGLDTYPRLITVAIKRYHQYVTYRGFPGVEVGDTVTVAHYRQGDLYEVVGIGGSGGASSVPLDILQGYARGNIIRGGATAWEAYYAANTGYALVGDGTDIVSTPDPTWGGRHSWHDGAGVTAYIDEDGSAYFDGPVGIGIAPVVQLHVDGVVRGEETIQSVGGTPPTTAASANMRYIGGEAQFVGYDWWGLAFRPAYLMGEPSGLTYGAADMLIAWNNYITIYAGDIRGSAGGRPDLGTTTWAEKMGNVYLGTSRDIYPMHDADPVFARLVDWGRNLATQEHFRQGADDLVWTGWANYAGFASPPDTVAHVGSVYRVAHAAAIRKAFRYRPYKNAQTRLWAKIALTANTIGGLMVDDGTDAGDGEGANNFYRVYLDAQTGTNNIRLVREYRTGGGALTTNAHAFYLDPVRWHGVILSYGIGTRWTNWGCAAYICGDSGFNRLVTWDAALGFAWTPARHGLYFENLSASASNIAAFDWFEE